MSLLHAFIDESGQRARGKKASAHFIMAAVIVADEDLTHAKELLARLRLDLRRRPGDHLSWKNLKPHGQRLHVAKTLASQPWLTVSTVVVCKQHLTGEPLNEDQSYLYTLRFLLERLSWIARDRRRILHYTMAHIQRFKIAKLREYEENLRKKPDTSIEWGHLNPRGGRMDQPQNFELLQLGDLAASACGSAFNVDGFGNTERRYLQELSPCLYRRGSGPACLTSYGLKMHPRYETTKAAYPWVATL
ncbi:DUF3800 domain-containing protein [Prauserella cavernicola]|uniref:DUF3800 domain-containing protein n=1 Tax=Prauserella cavernicola TaxID=2800127 RepID=A0A934QYP0_9PSEU|nr:DUF3800 domain-containing protein [Prauserella cavernicola]MBK1788856.1 DUF3800 domain-containing protein [Prauserella cavernicola]